MNNINEKRCTKCHKLQTFSLFSKNPKTKDRLSSWCLICLRKSSKNYLRNKRQLINDNHYTRCEECFLKVTKYNIHHHRTTLKHYDRIEQINKLNSEEKQILEILYKY